MKILPWIIATVALSSLAPTPAPAASGGPVSLVYRFPGGGDDGTASGGGARIHAVTCTLFSGVNEDLVVAVRQYQGSLITAQTYSNLVPFRTFTVVTHGIRPALIEDAILPSAGTIIDQGSFAIASTTTAIVCTAQDLNAGVSLLGFDMHGIRYNSDPGSQE